MADVAHDVNARLAELLRHPEDLDKIAFFKSDMTRKKLAIDAQLKAGLKEQLEVTQSGLNAIGNSQKMVGQIKEELMKIDKLCAESQTMIKQFPNIDLVSRVHRNFSQVETMKANIESFDSKVDDVSRLLSQDDGDLENQANLLQIHYALTQLRDIRDDAMDQVARATDTSLEMTLANHFGRLDDVVGWFDEHIGQASMNLIPLVQSENTSLIVRLAVIIDEEERSDKRARILRDAQREYKDVALRFKSINHSARQVRGYKEKFLKAIELYAQQQFDECDDKFIEEPSKISKIMAWYFNDLFTVKKGMVGLMPKKWKIFTTYTTCYHRLMHDWLIKRIDHPDLAPPQMLALIDWVDKYYSKMAKLGWEANSLTPHVLDDRQIELLREYRQLIVHSVDEWMERMFAADKKAFLERLPDSLDTDEHGYFRTKTLGDLWRMLREQLLAAGESERTDVAEGVIDAMFAALKSRQGQWLKMIEEEIRRYKAPSLTEPEGLHIVQDWLLAVANDQIACINDDKPADEVGYLTRFQRDLEGIVSPMFIETRSTPELEALRDGYVDFSTSCLSAFVTLIFDIDFRSVLAEIFTPKWYTEYGMKRIITTFEDYMADYTAVINPMLLDILVEEFADELLIHYLLCVRNKNVKFRRSDPFTDKFKDDVLTTFDWFGKYANFAEIKAKWRVVDFLVRMLESSKADVVHTFEEFKNDYWDLQMSWVESVLRTRDDCDRSLINSVKAKASEIYIQRGPETFMSKVK